MKTKINFFGTPLFTSSIVLFILSMLLSLSEVTAQLPAHLQIVLEKTYGDDKNEGSLVVRPTPDGGFLIGGNTASFDVAYRDIYLVKTDCGGNVIWSKTYGALGDDRLQWAMNNNLQLTSDGGIIMVGTTREMPNGKRQVLVIKTNSNGVFDWQLIFGNPDKENFGRAIQETAAGDYVLTGQSGADVYVRKIKQDGTFGFEEFHDLNGTWANGQEIVETSSGNFVITGNGGTGVGVFLLYVNANGGFIDKKLAIVSSGLGYNIEPTSDGGFIMCGRQNPGNAFLAKLNSGGRITGGPWILNLDDNNYAYAVQQEPDGSGYIVVGETWVNGQEPDGLIAKADNNGNVVWSDKYSGTQTDWLNSIQRTNDGGYIVSGRTVIGPGNSDIILLKLGGSDHADYDGDGKSICAGDCDDRNPDIYPGNIEICDGQDNNCDGQVDEGFDQDGDGVADCVDNCPGTPNPDQLDADCDGVGDICDTWPGCDDNKDSDNDGTPDCIDLDEMANWPCGNKGNKVTVCQVSNGNHHEICIAPQGVPGHLNGNNYIGDCDQISCSTGNRSLDLYKPGFNELLPTAFELFPNPATNSVNLDLKNYLEQDISISIFNQLGQLVLHFPQQELHNPLVRIDLSNQQLPAGIYMLSVKTANNQVVKQFVIGN